MPYNDFEERVASKGERLVFGLCISFGSKGICRLNVRTTICSGPYGVLPP